MLGRADVSCDQHRLASGLLNQALRFLRVLVFIQIGDQHVRTLAREGDGDRPADAAIAAGDDGFQSFELARSLVGLFAVIGPRVHGRGRTRHGLLLGGEGRPGLFVHGDLSWRTVVSSFNGRMTGPVPKRFGVTAQRCE